MQTIKKKIWSYRYTILIVVFLAYAINYIDRIAVLTFLPYIQKDLNLTPVEVGQLASVFFFAYGLAMIFSGFLTDKLGAKKVMNIAVIVFTAATFLTGLVKNFVQLLALRIGLGFGEGHHFVPSIRIINSWFPSRERGRATSFFVSSAFAASAIVPILVTSLSIYFFGGAWRPVFFVLAVPGLIGILLIWYFVYNTPKEMLDKNKLQKEDYDLIVENNLSEKEQEGTSSLNKKEEMGILLKDRSFYVYNVLLLCQNMVYWGTTTWLTTFLVNQHGLNLQEMGFFASVPYIVAFFSIMIGGWLMDKVFHRMKPVGLIAYIGCIPILLILGTIEKGNTGVLLLLLIMVGFFVNLNYGSVYAYIQYRYPKEVIGRATGISNGIGYFGGFFSSLISGYLVIVNADGTQNFGNVFIFFAVTAGIAALCTFLLKDQSTNTHVKNIELERRHAVR